jgi:hypothetical protein
MYKMLKQKGAKQNKPAKKIRKDQCLARTEAFLGCLPERGHFLGKLRTSSEIQRQSLLSWACVQRRGPTQANPFFFCEHAPAPLDSQLLLAVRALAMPANVWQRSYVPQKKMQHRIEGSKPR